MVNIFIPLSDPIEIAKILDDKRLGKQRVEAKQIITIITGEAKSLAWSNHPAVIMWRPYAKELKYYYDCIVREWIRRGYVNNMPIYGLTINSDNKTGLTINLDNKTGATINSDNKTDTIENSDNKILMPWFMYCKPVLLSHQASLLRKNYDHYHKHFKSKSLKPFMTRSYLWIVENPHYLTEEKIKYLKEISNKSSLPKSFNIDEYTKAYEA